jgi:Apea-like HEPN
MKEFHRAIFFTKVPMSGYYKYKDVFQIFPCDMENMPTSTMQNHFPNILEFWTTDEEIIEMSGEFEEFKGLFDKTATSLVKQDKILSLLSTFTNNLFFRYTDLTGTWGIPMLSDDPGKEANSWSSKWCLNMYHFPDLPRQFKIESFTEQKIRPIDKIEHKLFYTYDPNIDFDNSKDIILPATIDRLFDAYYALDKNISTLIDTAISFTISAIELKSNKKTLSLLASFTSLETMVNLEFKDLKPEMCKECSQPRYSIARKFREYLLKYIGQSDKNKKKFNGYYSLRSKIIHTGQQLKTELLFADVSKSERQEELLTRIEILQIGKLAITNWLLMRQAK